MVLRKPKLGKVSCRLARVMKTETDEVGLCRKVMLEAKPPCGKPDPPYEPKALQRFKMSVQRLELIHPREKNIPSKDTVVSLMKARYKATITEISN